MTPSVGRIVHYVGGLNNCLAAIVTHVSGPAGSVSLHIFPPPGPDVWHGVDKAAVTESGDGHVPDTWHWPEGVQ